MAKLLNVNRGGDLKVVEYGPRLGFLAALTSASATALTPRASASDIAGAVVTGLASGKGATDGLASTSEAAPTNGSPITLQYRAVL